MPQLIAFLIILFLLYLYCRLMYWLWVVVGPELMVLGSILGTGLVPVVYGIAVFRVFDNKSWRRILWAPIFALLALIYFDLAFLVLHSLRGMGRVGSLEWVLARIVEPFVILLPGGNSAHIEELFLNVLLGTAVKGILIAALLLMARGLGNTVADSKQPAFRQYFFGQALIDLRHVVESVLKMSSTVVMFVVAGIWRASAPVAIIVWPLTITAYLALIPPLAAGALALAILLPIHFLGVAFVAAVNLFFAAMFFCIERAVILARSGYVKCPHAGCHEPVPLPIFFCPECGAEHDRLIPGRCGVFFRACSCGKALLPTTFWLGKTRLRSACSHCNNPLSQQLFRESLHIPIYGAASSGKTMFMMAATWQLIQGQFRGVKADFINALDRRSYTTTWRPGFEDGKVREKTHQLLPDAFLLSLRRLSGPLLSLYMYDPAGEAIERGDEIEGHRFLRYFDGLAILIDPLSLPSFRRLLEENPGGSLATTSAVDPLDVVHRVINILESQSRLLRDRHFHRRVAVVITKADIPLVRQKLGLTACNDLPGEKWHDVGLAEDRHVRTWMKRNEPGLLQLLETRFGDLRFFLVSALGHDPLDGTKFEPRQVLQPLCWLLSKRPAMARPHMERFAGRAAEVAAVMLVLTAFSLPLFLFSTAVFRTVLGIGASRKQAAAQAVLAAAQAADRARQNEAIRKLERARVEQGIVGQWSGAFGSHRDAQLSISKDGMAIRGVLLAAGFRETLRGELLADNRLMLTPMNVTRVSRTGANNYSPDTVWIELDNKAASLKGSYRDTSNHTGSVAMTRRVILIPKQKR